MEAKNLLSFFYFVFIFFCDYVPGKEAIGLSAVYGPPSTTQHLAELRWCNTTPTRQVIEDSSRDRVRYVRILINLLTLLLFSYVWFQNRIEKKDFVVLKSSIHPSNKMTHYPLFPSTQAGIGSTLVRAVITWYPWWDFCCDKFTIFLCCDRRKHNHTTCSNQPIIFYRLASALLSTLYFLIPLKINFKTRRLSRR